MTHHIVQAVQSEAAKPVKSQAVYNSKQYITVNSSQLLHTFDLMSVPISLFLPTLNTATTETFPYLAISCREYW